MIDGPILVVKLADIGDAVLALPAIQALNERFPDSRIDVLTTPAGASVFRLSPAVDDVLTMEKQRFDHIRGLVSPGGLFDLARLTLTLRRRRYAAIVILHHLTTAFGARKFRALARATAAPVVGGLDNGRGDFLTHRAVDYGFGAMTEWEYGLSVVRALGASDDPQRPRLAISQDARESARTLLNGRGIPGRYVVIHPEVGEFSPARRWPVERFLTVARELEGSSQLGIVFVGTGVHPEIDELSRINSRCANLCGQTSFEQLCAVVSQADLVIGCDSSVTHLAGALDRPVIALFGPSNVAAWKPYGALEHVPRGGDTPETPKIALHLDLPCSPCFYTGFRLGRPQGCPLRSCMMEIDANTVSKTAWHVLRVSEQSAEPRDGAES